MMRTTRTRRISMILMMPGREQKKLLRPPEFLQVRNLKMIQLLNRGEADHEQTYLEEEAPPDVVWDTLT